MSKETAPDIDGWIAQAKQLRSDIVKSEESSHGIVRQAKESDQLQGQSRDVSAKVNLLQEELSFSTTLSNTLGRVHGIRHTLDLAREAILVEKLADAVGLLVEVEQELDALRSLDSTRISSLFKAKINDLRNVVAEAIIQCWDTLLHTDAAALTISIRHEALRRHLNHKILFPAEQP